MSIGENIKKYRKLANLTQKELAKKVGITAPTITKYEKGDLEPNLDTIKDISKVLGVSYVEIIEGTSFDTFHQQYKRKFISSGGMYIAPSMDMSSILNLAREKFTEDELIEFLISDYNDNIFDNKYNTKNITNDQIEELKPIIRGIVEMSLNTYNK